MRQTDDEIAQEVWDLLEFDLEYKENYTYEDFYVMLGVAKVFNSCNYRIKPDRWITKDGHHIPIIDNIEMYVKRMLYGKIFKSKEEDVQKVLKGYVSKSVPECWTEHSDKTSKSKGVIYPSKYPETIAGVKRGWEMSHEEADSGKVNPNYLFDIDAYKYNCQCCVVAYEVRRRGFDVEAAPQEFMGKPFELAKKPFSIWIDPKTDEVCKPTRIHAEDAFDCYIWLKKHVKRGERYHFVYFFETIIEGELERSGHIVTIEKDSYGRLRYYDPQTNKEYIDDEMFEKLGDSIIYGERRFDPQILRVDDKNLNPYFKDDVVEKSSFG